MNNTGTQIVSATKWTIHKKPRAEARGFAVRTGLEPATSGVTGRYSNQLNYRTRVVRTSFSKASAKVLLFFELTKFFGRKMQKNMHFFDFCFVFEYYTMQIWRFLCFSIWLTLFSLSSCLSGEKQQLLMPNDGAKQLLRFLHLNLYI